MMEPFRIDDSEWSRKEASVPLRKILIKNVSSSNFLIYQDFVNNLISWIHFILYVYYLHNI